MRNVRENEAIDDKKERQEKERKRRSDMRQCETSCGKRLRLDKQVIIQEQAREKETAKEKRLRCDKQLSIQNKVREKETAKEKSLRCDKQLSIQNKVREKETAKEKSLRCDKQLSIQNKVRAKETAKEKSLRCDKQLSIQNKVREKESTKEKRLRCDKQLSIQNTLREKETAKEKRLRCDKKLNSQNKVREKETAGEKRLRCDKQLSIQNKVREKETTGQKSLRIAEQQKRQIALRVKKNSTNELVISKFLKNVKDSVNYICCSCHRLLFRMTVIRLHEEKYKKTPKSVLSDVLSFRLKSHDGQEWICRTCDLSLKRGKLPAQSKANKLSLVEQPKELKDLNPLELRLLCQRIPFMKMVALPRGRQHGIHGPAVNVPSKLDAICQLLPRLPSESQIVSMKLKRRLTHSSHYMHDHVRPDVVLNALRWLKRNNPHYSTVEINENWVEDAEKEDSELWQAVSFGDNQVARENDNQGTDSKEQTDKADSNVQSPDTRSVDLPESTSTHQFEVVSMSDLTKDCRNDFEKLAVMARQSEMNVIDVPGDGNCMFFAFWYHLERLDITNTNVRLLRTQISEFMQQNREHYIDFIGGRIANEDLSNADTEQPTVADLVISEITDKDSQKEVQWVRYLNELENGSLWGDHVILQALADMYSLTVNVHATGPGMIHTVKPRVGNNGPTIALGLIAQSHYVIFEPYSTLDVVRNANVEVVNDSDSDSDEDSDEVANDEHAFEEASKVRGLPYETCMMNEDPELLNKMLSVAPADGQKPMPLLSDPNFEELSNPDKYPDGTNAMTEERTVALTPRRYFNQRLLDADGRFGISIEYLLSAQYATECKQVTSDINHYIFRRASGKHFQGKRLSAGMVKSVEQMKGLVKSDQAYRMLKNVRGTPAYFQTVFYDVLAIVRQPGIPTWFFTVSAADMQWPDVIQTIARQYGTVLSDQDVKELSFVQRSQWLRMNPVTAARQFQYRLELLFRDVLKSNAQPLGEIVDYVIRIEFQARGSPHAHTLLWVKDAPKIDVDSDEDIASFTDKYISCAIPEDDPELTKLVKDLQTHSHSAYCRKKGHCRFNFPRPPAPLTIVSREPDDPETSNEKKEHATSVLKQVKDVICDKSTPKDGTLADILDKAGVSLEIYTRALLVSDRGKNIVLKRTPEETFINSYNPTVLKAWQANIDVQYIIDAYACVMYIAAYMTKNEKGIGELLKQVCKEYKDQEIKSMLRRVGSVFLNHREVSAQEAVYRILSMPMKRFSREVLFVNTDTKSARPAVLKPKEKLEELEDCDENIFQSNILERYPLRPDSVEYMCLADFASNYKVSYGKTDEDIDDSVPVVLDVDDDVDTRERLPKYIRLKRSGGVMHKRKREGIIRFRKLNLEKNPSDFYRAKLMLFLPWRNEDIDLLGEHEDYASHYFAVTDSIHENEAKFSENLELVEQAVENHGQYGPPEHAWANIAPGAEHDNLQDVNEVIDIERDIDQEDLEDNAAMIQNPKDQHIPEISARYQAEAERETLEDSEYRQMIRGLTEKQAQIVFYNRKWCKETVIALRKNNPIQPYHVFLSGPGGVGKSYVIKLIQSDARKLLRMSTTIKPSDVTVLLTAPTGVAAFNIGGMTIHSALLLQTRKYGGDILSFEKLNSLRSKLENLHLLIIDEVSMIGSDILLDIHKRLHKIKGVTGESAVLGNVSVLAVGDMYQLPPVKQTNIYQPVRDPVERLNGNMWKDNFKLHELDEIVRQKDDCAFADMLCRIRVGKHTEADVALLKSREISVDNPSYPHDALHVFAYNMDVDNRNLEKLRELEPDDKNLTYIHASDDKTDSTGQLDLEKVRTSAKRSETGGLHTVLVLTKGARVMLTYNVDTADGLVNGVIGTVESIVKTDNGKTQVVLVKFDNDSVGRNAIRTSQWKQEYADAIPIQRHEGRFEKGNKKGAQISRRQFPLTLAWAVTIHKCQGLTVENIVVNMKGAKRFGKGQAYVAFSRVKTFQGLYVVNFDAAGIKANAKLEIEMEDMRQNKVSTEELKLMDVKKHDWTTVGHLNVRYFLQKLPDLLSPRVSGVLQCTDVMCFTETYLTANHNIDAFCEKYGYTAFRQDIPSTDAHGGLHGVMICARDELQAAEMTHERPEDLECKIVTLKTRELTIVLLYRKPSFHMDSFLERFEILLRQLPLETPVIVLGDFNDDLSTNRGNRLTNLMAHFGFKQLVMIPTTDRGTLIDHIYYNKYESHDFFIDVHDTYFSDHDMTFLTTQLA